ncbi:MAG TPA: Fe-S protein assembly co-chaperone HscB [Burkholderiaceae bacterium]|nr:Fe-S protein assembly co-chaperone HscB [Burkholderiaceae bacterium]
MKLEDDDFVLFGLPRRFALDESALGARWRELQSRVHPDRFAAEGATAQRLAMQWAVRINEAHRRLKEPLARAAYLCELAGHPLQGPDAKAVAPDVLARQMQWHEALAEASSADAIRALDTEVRDRLEAVRAAVASELDERQDPRAAVGGLREWMFLARLRSEIERRLEALEV